MESDISIMLALLQDDLLELEEMQIVDRKEITGNDLPVGVPHKPTDARIYVVSDHTPEEGDTRDVNENGHPYVELLFPGGTAKLLVDEPPPQGHTAALLVYNTHSKKAVVETDQDLLTNEEYGKHAKEVVTSIKDELKTWIDHKCFRRRARQGAWNVLDVRWVGKWKKSRDAGSGQMVRKIRMRMTLRGFKDKDAAIFIRGTYGMYWVNQVTGRK